MSFANDSSKRQEETKEEKVAMSKSEDFICIPIGRRVLIRKDENKKKTKGGIALPDSTKLPQITGRILAISAELEHDEDFQNDTGECILKQYDRVLFDPTPGIPVDLEAILSSDGADLLVVPIESVVAVFRKESP